MSSVPPGVYCSGKQREFCYLLTGVYISDCKPSGEINGHHIKYYNTKDSLLMTMPNVLINRGSSIVCYINKLKSLEEYELSLYLYRALGIYL